MAMVDFLPDGTKVLTVLTKEGSADYTIDPEGRSSIGDINWRRCQCW